MRKLLLLLLITLLKIVPKGKGRYLKGKGYPHYCSRCGWSGFENEMPDSGTEEGASCPECGSTGWYITVLN